MTYQLIQTMRLPGGAKAEVSETAPQGTSQAEAVDYFSDAVAAVREDAEATKATLLMRLLEVGDRHKAVLREEVFNR